MEMVPNPLCDERFFAQKVLCARSVRRNQYKFSLKIIHQSVLRLPEKLHRRREYVGVFGMVARVLAGDFFAIPRGLIGVFGGRTVTVTRGSDLRKYVVIGASSA